MAVRKILCFVALAFLCAALIYPQEEPPQSSVSLLPEPGVSESSVPFEEGEELKYEINWKPIFLFPAFRAGGVRMTVDKIQYKGADAFKVSAWATSEGIFKSVMGLEVKDYFEAIVDAHSFRSYRYFYKSQHSQRVRELEVIIDYERGERHLRELDTASEPPRVLRDERASGLPAPITDTLSVFYAARLRELRKGQQYFIHLNDNGKIKEVHLVAVERDDVRIDLGEYETLKLSTVGTFFPGAGGFHIWYSRNGLRLPVKFEADVRFGKVYGQLIGLQTPRMTKSRVRTP